MPLKRDPSLSHVLRPPTSNRRDCFSAEGAGTSARRETSNGTKRKLPSEAAAPAPLRVPLPVKLSPPRALGSAKAGRLKRPNAPLSARGSGCGASEGGCITWCLTLSFERESPVSRSVFPGCREAPGEGPEAAPCERDGQVRRSLDPRGRLRCGSGTGVSSSGAEIFADVSHRPSGLTCGDCVLSRGGRERPLAVTCEDE